MIGVRGGRGLRNNGSSAGLSIPGVKVGVRGGITGGGGASFFAGGAGMVRDGRWPSKSGDFSA